MTIKEAKEWLSKYPDDAEVYSHVVARNGRGGTFEEKLLFDGSHIEEKDGRKTVYLSYGFEIGWRNAHPEFQPPADSEAEADEELRTAVFIDLRQAFGKLTPFATEETPFGALNEAGEHEWEALLATCRNLYNEGAISYVPDSVERLKAFNTFGDLIDYLVDGPSKGRWPDELRKSILDDLVCQLDDAPEITEDTVFEGLGLDSMDIMSLIAATKVLHEEGKTNHELPQSAAALLACKTFGGLIDYLLKGQSRV